MKKFILFLTALTLFGSSYAQIRVGAVCMEKYLMQLAGKRVALCCNQTSKVGNTHLLDTLRTLGIDVRIVFTPEHGFRGDAEAGAKVNNTIDAQTGLPLISLYGKKKNRPLYSCKMLIY